MQDHDNNESLAELQKAFLEEVPVRLRAIRAAYELIDWRRWHANSTNMLVSLLHKLIGSAGTLGQPSLSTAASNLHQELIQLNEQLTIDEEIWSQIGRQITRLEQLTLSKLPSHAFDRYSTPAHTGPEPPLLYLVDDDNAQTQGLRAKLASEGYGVKVFSKLDVFLEACQKQRLPHAILMDMEFASGRLQGANIIAELKADPRFSPVVIFVSVHDDLRSRLAAFRAGASRYFTKPYDQRHLLNTLDELVGRNDDDPYRVLLVDDDALASKAYALALSEAGFKVNVEHQALDTLKAVREFQPDVLLLDVYMPEATGPELAAVLREDERLAWMPILFLSAESDPSKHAVALALGGDDFLIKPVRGSYLVSAVRARAWRARRNRRLIHLAFNPDSASKPS